MEIDFKDIIGFAPAVDGWGNRAVDALAAKVPELCPRCVHLKATYAPMDVPANMRDCPDCPTINDLLQYAAANYSAAASEPEYLEAIQESFIEAARVIDLVGVPSEEEDPEAWNEAFERVSHCGTCTVREVMNVVWPNIERYIAWMRAQQGQPPTPFVETPSESKPETLMSLHERGEFD